MKKKQQEYPRFTACREVTANIDTELKLIEAKAATCTAEGYTGDKVCESCGNVITEGTAIAKVAHDYEDGKCKGCGVADPSNKISKTGDSANLALWASLMALSAMGLGIILVSKKRYDMI